MIPAFGPEIKLEGMVQFQSSTSPVDSVPEWDAELRRMRVTLDGNAGPKLSGRLMGDFDSNRARIRDAYVDWRVVPAFTLRGGQFKPPFNLIELTSAKRLLVIERGNRIRGSRALTTSNLLADVRYAARNRGVMGTLRVPGPRLTVQAGGWLGSGEAGENDDGKELAARLEWNAIPASEDGPKPLTIGLAAVTNGYFGGPRDTLVVVQADSLIVEDPVYGAAFELAAEYGAFGLPGFHALANAVVGDNPRSLSLSAGDDEPELGTFRGLQVWMEMRVPLSGFLTAVGPAFRLDHLDPDTDREDDANLFLTPGLNLYLGENLRFQANVDVLVPEDDELDTDTALRLQTELLF